MLALLYAIAIGKLVFFQPVKQATAQNRQAGNQIPDILLPYAFHQWAGQPPRNGA
jgi:hypothetical protein